MIDRELEAKIAKELETKEQIEAMDRIIKYFEDKMKAEEEKEVFFKYSFPKSTREWDGMDRF